MSVYKIESLNLVIYIEENKPLDNINLQDDDGYSPLHLAAELGKEKIVESLIKGGANKEIKDFYGFTPLHVAAELGKEEIVRLLISEGANKEAKENDGFTAYDLAIRNGHYNILYLFFPSRSYEENTILDLSYTSFSNEVSGKSYSCEENESL